MANKTALDAFKNLFRAAKAMPDDLEDIEDVFDLWNEPGGQHKLPSEAEIKTGPREESSGDGAFKMVGEYSDPSKQSVMVDRYDEMSRWFDKAGRAMKAMQQKQDLLTAALFEAIKSDATAPEATTSEDSYLGKATAKLKVAKSALRKADMADEDEEEERDEHMEKAERALASAKRLLAKAEDEEDEDEVEKAFADLKNLTKAFKKASAEFAKAEDEDEKDEDEDETKKSAVTKAEDEDERDDEDETKKSTVTKAEDEDEKDDEDETKKSDQRLKMLELKIEDVMNVVAGKSRFESLPDMVKSMPTESIGDRIEKAIEDGVLTENAEIMKAQDLHLRLQAAQAGQYDGRRLQSDIENSSDKIRNLFKTAA